MNIFDVINKRHCYRQGFLPEPVPRDDLQTIIDAGVMAPSGRNLQTTYFIGIDDSAILEQIRPVHGMPAVQQATAMIACVVDVAPEPDCNGMCFQIEDCAAAVQNMLLAVTALGYASVWIDGALRVEDRAARLADILHLPKGKIVRVLLPIGKPAEAVGGPEKRTSAERSSWNRYR